MSRSFLTLLTAFLFLCSSCDRDRDGSGRSQREDVQDRYWMGISYYKHGQLDKAAREYEACLKGDPNYYEARVELGRVHIHQYKFDLSVRELNKAIEIDPDRVEAHLLLGEALMHQKKFYQSYLEFKRAVEIDPGHIESRVSLGEVLMNPATPTMNLQESKRQFQKALELNPGSTRIRFFLAVAELNLGEFEEAAKKFKALTQEYTRYLDYHYLLGVTHLRAGEYEDAISSLKRVVDIEPLHMEAKWNLRLAYAQQGGYPNDLHQKYKIELSRQGIVESPVKFTDIAPESGTMKVDRGRGSAWGDYDNDGDLDIFAVGNYDGLALYRNNGNGTFDDVTQQSGVDDPNGGWAALFADYDNDGDLDIYVTKDGWNGNGRNTLYRNNGDGRFDDVTEQAGVGDTRSSFCAAFGDYDNDGFLDIYIANGIVGDGSPNALYRNNGDGTFKDVSAQAGVNHKGKAIGTAFGDYDNDGDLDIYVVNSGQEDVLYRNNGDGTYLDVTELAGVAGWSREGFITFFLDYNNDGYLDIFVSTMATYPDVIESHVFGKAPNDDCKPLLFRNNQDGTFSYATDEAKLHKCFGTMGGNFGDVDNDGYLDIYFGNGGPQMWRLEPSALLYNNGDGTFSDITESAGVGHIGKTHGVIFADYDYDGDQDIYAAVGGALEGDRWANKLYRNEGNGNNWLTVKLVGTKSNRDGIGAKVTVTTGQFLRYAEVSGGCGFGSTNSLPLEFGLGSYESADLVEIKWPSGIVQSLKDVPANQIITVVEDSGP